MGYPSWRPYAATHLECHEFVVRLRGPCVDLDRVLQRNHQELDALVLDDLEVNGALQIANVDPAVAAFDLLLHNMGHLVRDLFASSSVW